MVILISIPSNVKDQTSDWCIAKWPLSTNVMTLPQFPRSAPPPVTTVKDIWCWASSLTMPWDSTLIRSLQLMTMILFTLQCWAGRRSSWWMSSENAGDEKFVWDSCFEWQLVMMTESEQNWRSSRWNIQNTKSPQIRDKTKTNARNGRAEAHCQSTWQQMSNKGT